MAKTKPTKPVQSLAPAPAVAESTAHQDAVQAIKTDQYAGQGGCYVYDPVTKTRTPATD